MQYLFFPPIKQQKRITGLINLKMCELRRSTSRLVSSFLFFSLPAMRRSLVYLLLSLYLFATVFAQTNCGPFQDSSTQLFWESQPLLAYPSSVHTPSSFAWQGLTFSLNSSAFIVVYFCLPLVLIFLPFFV
jgi:hypothetical protein